MTEENYDPLRETGEGLFKSEGGNIWGWKFSYFALIVIVLFVGMLTCRQIQNPGSDLFEDPNSTPKAIDN